MKIVIIGSSAAAISSAETLRKLNPDIKITMISSDDRLPYYRPMLSHMIGESEYPANFYLKTKEYFQEKNISIILNTKVIGIDKDKKIVTTENNANYEYDKLILCTGSNNFVPPLEGTDKKGVYTIKYASDIENINKSLDKVKKAVIIGGGLLGIEAAWSLLHKNIDVSMVEFSDRLMPRQLDVKASKLVLESATKSGIKFYLGESSKAILGEESVTGVELSSKKILDADMVIISVGVRANLDLPKGCKIDCDRGIMVTKNLKTCDEDIYAAGDNVQIGNSTYGIWPAAMQMGKIAAANVLGDNKEFEGFIPATILKGLEIGVYSAGDIEDKEGRTYEIVEDSDNYKKLVFENDILVGGLLIGETKLSSKIYSALTQKKTKSQIIDENWFV